VQSACQVSPLARPDARDHAHRSFLLRRPWPRASLAKTSGLRIRIAPKVSHILHTNTIGYSTIMIACLLTIASHDHRKHPHRRPPADGLLGPFERDAHASEGDGRSLAGTAKLAPSSHRSGSFAPFANRAPRKAHHGVVTLRCEEARGIAPYGFSSGRDDLVPRTHRRGTEHAVRLS
jgi:hypothetical protein